MADYCNIRAPQWRDFTQNCSPVQVQDFFEKEHTIHECIEEPCSAENTAEKMENAQSVSQDILCVNPQAQADLDIIKSTPVKVISPKYHNKETVVAEGTYDQVFNDAMRKLELCKKVPKPRDVLNKSTQEPKIFKTPNMPKITKISRSVGSVLNKNNQFNQDSTKVNKTSNNYVKKLSIKQSLFEQDKNSAENNTFKKSNNPNTENNESKQYNKEDEECKEEANKECKEEDSKECKEEDNNECNKESNNKKCNEEDNEKYNEEYKKLQDGQIESTDDSKNNEKAGNSQDDIDAKNDRTQSTKQIAVLTWQNHRRNIHRRRTSVNRYIGLAEAVSRFQNETPKRFRTKSNKNNTISPSFYTSKLTQNRLKPTIPISPALVSKTRTRPVTVLSQEEREMLEIEEMKKYRIKANPIPSNVLRGPRATTKVNNFTKKPMITTNTSSAIQSNEKTKSSSQIKSPHRDKASGLKNTIPNVIMSDSEGIIVKHEEMAFFGVPKNTTKNVTRVVPFSFEARNKDMQMKKEQRLKNLQEASKTKVEFHARPAPNFSKPSTASSTKPPMPSAKQQQNTKRLVEPCPFSFEERNRKLMEKKEQLVKQVLEENKRSRVFRANPAPVFKPVMVRGRSKELLSVKNKNIKTESEHNEEYKCENQENKEPNEIDSYKTEGEIMQRAAKSSACNDDKLPLKVLPLELNTDKRAIKRREFDEKLKQKEMEEEMKRQEQEKKQLEHEKQLKVELRKLAEVKAKPMPKYKPLITIKSTKQLTNPQSPAFASKLRSKQV